MSDDTQPMTRVCGFVGEGAAGLLEGVLRALRAQGQRVSVIEHRPELPAPDPSTAEGRRQAAGAFEVLLAGGQRLAVLRAFETAPSYTVHDLLAELVPADWVLVQGFPLADIHRIECWAPGRAPAYPDDPFVVAVACAGGAAALPEPTLRPVFELSDHEGLAAMLLASGPRLAWPADATRG
jgi:molybdopterin-guanine dinucleotide biosynthesis protein B